MLERIFEDNDMPLGPFERGKLVQRNHQGPPLATNGEPQGKQQRTNDQVEADPDDLNTCCLKEDCLAIKSSCIIRRRMAAAS